jgi:hypothetical protein
MLGLFCTKEDGMSNLEDIRTRRGPDRWKDAVFIGVALILTALSIGSVARRTARPQWSLTVIENPDLAR